MRLVVAVLGTVTEDRNDYFATPYWALEKVTIGRNIWSTLSNTCANAEVSVQVIQALILLTRMLLPAVLQVVVVLSSSLWRCQN